jgi:hypothetical protein
MPDTRDTPDASRKAQRAAAVRRDDEPNDPTPRAYDGWRTPAFAPRRRRWPGVLAAMAIAGVIVGLAVSSHYEQQTLGERIDHSLDSAGRAVQRNVGAVRDGVGDAGITAGVKTALAADPVLSALKIDVTTHDGVVSLEGPAPDQKARERASALAAAPDGVVRVDNRLVVDTAAAIGDGATLAR